jgi:hypothetical protein
MTGWRVKGVNSRLSVSTVTEESRNRAITTNLAEFVELAGGAVGEYAYTRDRPVRPITIHATHDKAHTLGGYFRYTADGTLNSETRCGRNPHLQERTVGQFGRAWPGHPSRSFELSRVISAGHAVIRLYS